MTVADLDQFLKSLGEFLAANQGKRLAADFEEFRLALQAFRDLTLSEFAIVLGAKADRRGSPPPKSAPKATKPRLKSAQDCAEVQGAVALLERLFESCVNESCSYSDIDAAVQQLASEFDCRGLKAIAQGFGIRSGLKSKEDARKRIEEKIKDRKVQFDRASRIQSSAARPTDPQPKSEMPLPFTQTENLSDG